MEKEFRELLDEMTELGENNLPLCHLSNILKKFSGYASLSNEKKTAIKGILEKYNSYIKSVLDIKGYSEDEIKARVDLLNEYYDFLKSNNWDNLFSSQGKFRSTILEEFLYILFKDYVEEIKVRDNDTENVVSSGSVKAYSNLYFKAENFYNFIHKLDIGVNVKDQDYAIFRSFSISIDKKEPVDIQIPAVAIEAKTYIDKTMLDSIIATAEKVKTGNPHCRFVAVTETYDVSFAVDPAYSRLDQIYVLRKGMRRETVQPIDYKVVMRLFNDTVQHMESPWSDIENRIREAGVVI